MWNDGDFMLNVKQQTSKAANLINLKRSGKYGKIGTDIKIPIFNTSIMSVLYGAVSWKSKKIVKITSFQSQYLWKLRVYWKVSVTPKVLRRANQPKESNMARWQRWSYLGHPLRMSPTWLPHQVRSTWTPPGKRKSDPEKHYADQRKKPNPSADTQKGSCLHCNLRWN